MEAKGMGGQTGGCAPAGVPTEGLCPFQDPGTRPAGRLSGRQRPGRGDKASMGLRPGPLSLESLTAGRWPAQRTGRLLQTWRTVPFLRVLFFSIAIETTPLLLCRAGAGLSWPRAAEPGLGNSDLLVLPGRVLLSHLRLLAMSRVVTSGVGLGQALGPGLGSGSGSLALNLQPGPAAVSTSLVGRPRRMPCP